MVVGEECGREGMNGRERRLLEDVGKKGGVLLKGVECGSGQGRVSSRMDGGGLCL
jgi:hypothetical protein